MMTLDDARAAVTAAIEKVSFERANPATTPAQFTALDAALDELVPIQNQIEAMQLDQAAAAVTVVVDGLRAVTDDARLDTLAQLKGQLGALLQQLGQQPANFGTAVPTDQEHRVPQAPLSPPSGDGGATAPLTAPTTPPATRPPPAPTTLPVVRPAPAPISGTGSGDNNRFLTNALDAAGITSRLVRNGLAAIIVGECHFVPQTEGSYAGTSVARIRAIFGSRVAELSDEQLTELRADDVKFFDVVYGGRFGNDRPGDGFRYRGRGLIQLTFRDNYDHFGNKVHRDLLTDPDVVNQPDAAAEVAVAYLERYKGGGFEALKRSVGNPVASTETVKDQAFQKFMANNTFGGVEA